MWEYILPGVQKIPKERSTRIWCAIYHPWVDREHGLGIQTNRWCAIRVVHESRGEDDLQQLQPCPLIQRKLQVAQQQVSVQSYQPIYCIHTHDKLSSQSTYAQLVPWNESQKDQNNWYCRISKEWCGWRRKSKKQRSQSKTQGQFQS